PGIPEQALEAVFEPFHTTKEEGTGLGLAVSYSIIQQHGGTIAASNAPGGGALFTIVLPETPMEEMD
ncbi:MAG: ATP-binding protein, partial [Anaerolineae bacterium]